MGRLCQQHGPPRELPNLLQSMFQPRLLLFLLLFLLVGSQQPPPNYPHDMMPDTNFTCSDKATGGYYADPEAGCQMFHVCVKVSDEEIRDFRFLCPNNTVFDQQNFICTNWWDINCKQSTRYYSKNDLFRVDETTANQDYEYEEKPFTTYEYVYEYDESQTRNSPDYEYDYYDQEVDHRFGSGGRGRKGKSQDSSTAKSTSSTSPTSTTSTTTSTTSRPISSTTTTTPRPVTRSTTPRITTLRPSHNFQSIRIGKPVVSISTSSRYEVSSSSSPSSDSHDTRPESPRSRSTSTRTTRQEDLSDAEELYTGVEDPFADFDWRRDSAGVTASTKTRYEQRFRSNAKSRQELPFSTASRNQDIIATTASSDKDNEEITTERNRYRGTGRANRNRSGISNFSGTRFRASTPDPALEEFSNFRYYKTAFGNGGSESPDQLLPTTTSTTASPQHSPSGTRVRPAGYISARSASRNTRYSVYG